MKTLFVWFTKGTFSGEMIGLVEYNDNRILIHEIDTVAAIENKLVRVMS